ncbi:SHOCT domain-containing protein [Halopiger thermotolerans]
MGRLGTLLLKGTGVLVLAFVALSVIATIVGILLSVVATVVSLVVSVAVLGLLVLGALGLFSMLRDRSASSDSSAGTPSTSRTRDPKSRLQERYVAGELSDAEFERELDRLFEADDGSPAGSRTRSESDRSRTRDYDRTNSRR